MMNENEKSGYHFSFFGIYTRPSFAQEKDPLFNTKQPLDIALTLSVKEIKKTKGDTIYLSHKLYYHSQEKTCDTIRVGLKSGS